MTNEEFEKIVFIKNRIENLETILYGSWGDSEEPMIQRLNISYSKGRKETDVTIPIPFDLSYEIVKLVESRLEKFKEQFEKFKTE